MLLMNGNEMFQSYIIGFEPSVYGGTIDGDVDGPLYWPCHILDEFHCARYQFGLVELPKLLSTYVMISPFTPIVDCPEGTLVRLNIGVPVSASKALQVPLELANSIGG